MTYSYQDIRGAHRMEWDLSDAHPPAGTHVRIRTGSDTNIDGVVLTPAPGQNPEHVRVGYSTPLTNERVVVPVTKEELEFVGQPLSYKDSVHLMVLQFVFTENIEEEEAEALAHFIMRLPGLHYELVPILTQLAEFWFDDD